LRQPKLQPTARTSPDYLQVSLHSTARPAFHGRGPATSPDAAFALPARYLRQPGSPTRPHFSISLDRAWWRLTSKMAAPSGPLCGNCTQSARAVFVAGTGGGYWIRLELPAELALPPFISQTRRVSCRTEVGWPCASVDPAEWPSVKPAPRSTVPSFASAW